MIAIVQLTIRKLGELLIYSTAPIIRPKRDRRVVESTKMLDNTETGEVRGAKQIETSMEVQCKHKIWFMNNYPTV
jgi:hypothetical protein